MNRQQSQYFSTAAKMDEALMALLEEKDFAFISVKELCQRAGVNRSTFYLHYETMGDLLRECAQYLLEQCYGYFPPDADVARQLNGGPDEALRLLTPAYLTPYLTYIRDHRRVFRTAVENAETLGLQETYGTMSRQVITPILERLGVPDWQREYFVSFYISGIVAVVMAWLRRDCRESVEQMTELLMQCAVRPNT